MGSKRSTKQPDVIQTESVLCSAELYDLRTRRQVNTKQSQPGIVGKNDAGSTERVQTASGRSPGRKDRDRLLYADSFHRLLGVTQVVSPRATARYSHNRLTHSLKVAQVARSIAEMLLRAAGVPGKRGEAIQQLILELGGLDADVTEAAALAHDLGHPPFGHAVEQALDSWAITVGRLSDGFEGNAQSFRIVAKVDEYLAGHGLNLTAATLAAVLKYPWARVPQGHYESMTKAGEEPRFTFMRKKFGFYGTEIDDYKFARAWIPKAEVNGYPRQTLEASIMDVADDITYAVHDFEDFYRSDLIDIRAFVDDLTQPRSAFTVELVEKLAEDYPDLFKPSHFRAACDDLIRRFSPPGFPFHYTALHRSLIQDWISKLNRRYGEVCINKCDA